MSPKITTKCSFKEKLFLSFQLFWRIFFLSMISTRITGIYLISQSLKEYKPLDIAGNYAFICLFAELVYVFLSLIWLVRTDSAIIVKDEKFPRKQPIRYHSKLDLKTYLKILFLSLLISSLNFASLTFFYFIWSKYGNYLGEESMSYLSILTKLFLNISLFLFIFILISFTTFFRGLFLNKYSELDSSIQLLKNSNKAQLVILQPVKLLKSAFIAAYALTWRTFFIFMLGSQAGRLISIFISSALFPNITGEPGNFSGIEIFLYILSYIFYVLVYLSFYLLHCYLCLRVFIKLEDLPFQKFKFNIDNSIKGKMIVGIGFFLSAGIISIPIVFGILSALPNDIEAPLFSFWAILFSLWDISTFVFSFFIYTAVFYLFAKLNLVNFKDKEAHSGH